MPAKKVKQGDGVGVGVALGAALAGVVATGFYLYGSKGVDNRKKVRAWTIKAKGEVLEQFEKMQELSKESYTQAIDKVTAKYAKLASVGEAEATKLNKELKRYWKEIETGVTKKKPKKSAPTKATSEAQ